MKTIIEIGQGTRRVLHYNERTGQHEEVSTALYTEQQLRLEGRTHEWVAPKALGRLPAGSARLVRSTK